MQVHLEKVLVKFAYQGHQTKVKVQSNPVVACSSTLLQKDINLQRGRF